MRPRMLSRSGEADMPSTRTSSVFPWRLDRGQALRPPLQRASSNAQWTSSSTRSRPSGLGSMRTEPGGRRNSTRWTPAVARSPVMAAHPEVVIGRGRQGQRQGGGRCSRSRSSCLCCWVLRAGPARGCRGGEPQVPFPSRSDLESRLRRQPHETRAPVRPAQLSGRWPCSGRARGHRHAPGRHRPPRSRRRRWTRSTSASSPASSGAASAPTAAGGSPRSRGVRRPAQRLLLRRHRRRRLEDDRQRRVTGRTSPTATSATGSVGAIAVAESDPNVIYVGMGEACIRGNVSHGDGVYKSDRRRHAPGRTSGLRDTRQIAACASTPRTRTSSTSPRSATPSGPTTSAASSARATAAQTWENVLFVNDSTGAVDLAWIRSNPRVLYAALLAGACARRGAW